MIESFALYSNYTGFDPNFHSAIDVSIMERYHLVYPSTIKYALHSFPDIHQNNELSIMESLGVITIFCNQINKVCLKS